MKLEHISASRIKTYVQCPLKYWALYEEELEEVEHPLTVVGSCLHKMFEVATKARMAGDRRVRLQDPMALK